MSACQAQAGDDTTETDDMIDVAKQCCPSPSKRSILDRLLRRSSPACLPPNPPANPPPNDPSVCTSTYTCRGKEFPNICANARSAIEARGYSNRMVRQRSGSHNTQSFWQNKRGSNSAAMPNSGPPPYTGWALQGNTLDGLKVVTGSHTDSCPQVATSRSILSLPAVSRAVTTFLGWFLQLKTLPTPTILAIFTMHGTCLLVTVHFRMLKEWLTAGEET